ncbi:MAG TPA: hypothetical protein VMH61_04910 [Candidatus Acidoferrales bacterium]|nr:hypothetical protein [Candidatus Acidoferrales bacterium]
MHTDITRETLHPHRALPLAAALTAWGALTAGLGLWLLVVCATVLPTRDPSREPLWFAVAIGCVAWAAVDLARVRRGSRAGWLVATVLALSVAALAFGFGALVSVIEGTHFEGYLVVIGLVLLGHGVTSIASVVMAARRAAA